MATIAIDYTPAHEQGGGIGRYVRDLTTALVIQPSNHDYRLFVAGSSSKPIRHPNSANVTLHATRLSPAWLARIWHKLRFPLPAEVFVGRVDLFHATDFVLPPLRPDTRSILTVHDLSFVRVPETASPPLKRYLDDVVPRSVRRADHILADSQSTKDDLIQLYNTAPEKITVLLSGVDARFKPSAISLDVLRRRYDLPMTDYIFSVGTVQPRKNYARLIEALAKLRTNGHDVSLVIAGGHGWLEDPIYHALRETNMQDHVHFIGFADDDDLPALYTHALCFVFPSLYEGFGLPILESMACGTPVLTSNVSSLPEVAGSAALMVDPYDTTAIAAGLAKIIDDSAYRQSLIEAGFAQAKHFTWERSASHLLKVYDYVLQMV